MALLFDEESGPPASAARDKIWEMREPGANTSPSKAKALGIFYTDAQIADFLVWWAIRSRSDTVMDPSFGGGVFLRSACQRLAELGGQPSQQVCGVEIDPAVHRRIRDKLADEFAVSGNSLLCCDFFAVDESMLAPVDVVVGNPPFIRYQRFSGEMRKRALDRAARHGVRLTELCSSWAPFVIHSVGILKPAGRLAMVVPTEIGHADYALRVLDFLRKSFRQVTFLTFQKKLFPDLNEDTLLVLAEGRQCGLADFLWKDLPHAGALGEIQAAGEIPLGNVVRMDARAVAAGAQRMLEYVIPEKARALYQEIKQNPLVCALREIGDVGIGYVTGANEFFHLGSEDARQWGIPPAFLRPAVRRSRALRGVRFTQSDWREGVTAGDCGYLLQITEGTDLPASVRSYLRNGEQRGVSKTYKCRTRTPWFKVPHVYRADAFLTYMSGMRPRLVANESSAVAPNTLHTVRVRSRTRAARSRLAALWQTSLTRLSVELEGHALGGGMLKLEPTEAENVLVPWPEQAQNALAGLADELDLLLRRGEDTSAESLADETVLGQGLGLSGDDCRVLRSAADLLRQRRYSRNAT